MHRNTVPGSSSSQPSQSFSVNDIKEKYAFLEDQHLELQTNYVHLAEDHTDMQRQYAWLYNSSYQLSNTSKELKLEMHRQAEIAKRQREILLQSIPLLSAENQIQVAAAMERAQNVTMQELEAILGNGSLPPLPPPPSSPMPPPPFHPMPPPPVHPMPPHPLHPMASHPHPHLLPPHSLPPHSFPPHPLPPNSLPPHPFPPHPLHPMPPNHHHHPSTQ